MRPVMGSAPRRFSHFSEVRAQTTLLSLLIEAGVRELCRPTYRGGQLEIDATGVQVKLGAFHGGLRGSLV